MAKSNIIRDLFVQLGVKVDPGSKKEVKAYEKAIEKVKDQLEDLAGWTLKAAVGLTGFLVAAGTAAGLLAVQTGSQAEAIERQARALNLTRKEYQETLHVFGTFGADAGEIADVFAQITEKAVDAAAGQQEAVQAFGYLGIKISELKGKRPIELFERLADGISKTADRAEALAGASKLLGEDSAKKLLPVLVQGAGAIRALRREANELGIVMDDRALATAKQAAVEFRRLKNVAGGLKNELGVALAPAVAAVLRGVTDWIRANRELLSQRIEDGIRTITRAILALDAAVKLLGGWDVAFVQVATGAGILLLLANLSTVEKVLGAINLAFAALRVAGLTVAGSLGVAFSPLILGLAALAAGLVLVGLAVDDFLTFWRGGTSVLGSNLDLIESMIPAFGAVRDLFSALVDLLLASIGNFDKISKAITEGLAPAFSALQLVLGPVLGTLSGIWELINKIAAAPIEGLTNFVRTLTLQTDLAGNLSAERIQTAAAGAVAGALPIAANAGQSIDQSVRSVNMNAVFHGPNADTVETALSSAMRRAQVSIAGGTR